MININEFNWKQLFNDSKGKTSAVLLSGFLGCVISLGGFLASGNLIIVMVLFKLDKDTNIIGFLNTLVIQSLALFTLSASMLGVHRLSKDKEISEGATKSE